MTHKSQSLRATPGDKATTVCTPPAPAVVANNSVSSRCLQDGTAATLTVSPAAVVVADKSQPHGQHHQPKHKQSEQDCYNASHERVS